MISSAAFMPHPPAHSPYIDAFEFASAGATQQGSLPLNGLPRLRDLLASDAGEVDYKLVGLRDAHGRPGLRVGVHGKLQLRCQRCLEAMQYEVREDDLLVLAATQAEIDGDPVGPEAPDRLLAGKDLSVRELVEDQLILALPYAPRHERCKAAEGAGKDDKHSPFAGLRGLVRGREH
jgi:uncharacterized protein